MPTLNDLTIPYIKKLARELQIELERGRKAELINQIENAGINPKKLEDLIEKYLKEKNQAKIKKRRKLLDIPDLEIRLEQLEKKVEYLISLISERNITSEKQVARKNQKISSRPKKVIEKFEITTLKDIKNFIKLILGTGDAITIDELIRINELQNISLNLLKQAINELIEDGTLIAVEGNSIQKIEGNIGELKRVK